MGGLTLAAPCAAIRACDEKAHALILIPARDEAASIGKVVRGCRAAGFSVVVIDDASCDETAARAREAGARVLPAQKPHHGKTAALQLALTELPDDLDWVFFLDGDGQHSPADLERFWRARSRADMVVGNRFPDAYRMPWPRRLTNRFMSRLLRAGGVADSQCGFRLVRRSWLGDWLPRGHHFQFETELALRAASRPTRVINLPIAALYAGEKSKIQPLRDTLNFLSCLVRGKKRTAAPAQGIRVLN